MPAMIDLTGQRFGRWTVIGISHKSQHGIYWKCKCDCGKIGYVTSNSLTRGNSKSCGCYHKEKAKESATKHGKSTSRLFKVWCAMIERTTNPKNKSYSNYGGRGIEVCDKWRDDFQAFYDWAMNNGYDENASKGDCTIDRIDVNGNYCPENCRWVGMDVQAKNKRKLQIEYNGEKHSVEEWADITGLKISTIYKRINCGWEIKDVLSVKTGMKREEKCRKLVYKGEEKTLREWEDLKGIPKRLILERIRNGSTVEEALDTPIGANRIKKIIIENIQSGDTKEFNTQREASEYIGCDSSSLNGCVKGKRKTVKGYRAFYKEDNR